MFILYLLLSSPTVPATTPIVPLHDRVVRGIHLTAWVANSQKYRTALDDMLAQTEINAVVIDIKEAHGEVYVPAPAAVKIGAHVEAIRDLKEWLSDLKRRGVYTIARIVVFKDNRFARKHPEAAVQNHLGDIWYDRSRTTWINPYHRHGWRYNLLIALEAADLGFEEIQFDYIRFPTDGNLKIIRYKKPHPQETPSQALVGFLSQAKQLLSPRGAKISVDVFGLVTSDHSGLGIGQHLIPLSEPVDFVCPMVYPSHYFRPEFGIPVPNKEPYRTVHHALKAAIQALGPEGSRKLRPYLQDFSLGVPYGPQEVRAQIQATEELGIQSWTLWNPRCAYTGAALKPRASSQRAQNTTYFTSK